ncbi:MAG: glycosyltransferase, partial [Saprospiraceae bacterium]|nr:glycosyltransferase [Saprospiraceae bacterium]
MKLLILTSRFPYPLDKGDKLRIYYQVRELSQYFEIILVSITDKIPDKEEYAELAPYCKSIYPIKLGRIRSAANTLWSIVSISKLPAQCAYFYSDIIRNKIGSIISAEAPDHIYCQLLRTSEYIKGLNIPKTMDFMDAFSTGASMRADKGHLIQRWFWKREASLLRKYESSISKEFDNLTIISRLDRDRLKDIENIQVVNNGIDARFFIEEKAEAQYDAVFVGNLGYYPNVRAVGYISEYILPAYEASYKKSLKVNIVGPNSSNVKTWESNHLNIGGWYDNVIDGFCSGRIFLAPLFEGIGQQNKILEAMAIGIPVVTTPDVAKALGMEHGNQLLVANTARSFSDCIHQFLTDKDFTGGMMDRARRFVSLNYEWHAVCQPLIKLI